jgi:TRAP-type mannitol/chloroaromatic compound transport system permease small subunit
MSDYLGRFFARLIPVLLILVMVVVIGRYFFGVGRVDIQELALYVHALIFLGCAGWAYSADEHVRVDIFYRNASPEYKKAVNTFGNNIFSAANDRSSRILRHRFRFSLLVSPGNLH